MKKILLTLFITISILFSSINANAVVKHDNYPGKPITKEDTIVDSIRMNGVKVDAYYSPRVDGVEYKYQCTELVNRFYKEVFGIENATWSTNFDKYFEKTNNPVPGDWQKSPGHDAIVKNVYTDNAGVTWVVTIDQNYWANNGNALWGRRASLDDPTFQYYHLKTNNSGMDVTQIEAFVKRLYKLCLNRNADAGGLKYWVNLLKSNSKTAAEVVKGFFDSNEMKNKNLSNEDFLETCYLAMMDRKSDSGGKKYWLDKLGNGMSRTFVLKGFVDSKEFTDICNKYGVMKGTIQTEEARDKNQGVTSFVVRCYTKALGRKYDINGLNFWTGKIIASYNPKEEALRTASDGFFHSKEFLDKNLSDEEFVKLLYRTFLGREYDNNGLKYWLNKLAGGNSRDEVMYGFAYSKEFTDIMKKYGL